MHHALDLFIINKSVSMYHIFQWSKNVVIGARYGLFAVWG